LREDSDESTQKFEIHDGHDFGNNPSGFVMGTGYGAKEGAKESWRIPWRVGFSDQLEEVLFVCGVDEDHARHPEKVSAFGRYREYRKEQNGAGSVSDNDNDEGDRETFAKAGHVGGWSDPRERGEWDHVFPLPDVVSAYAV
jgi:hypothetical protein